MTVDPRTDIPDAREIRRLWVGLLLPPIAFLISLEVAYALVPSACSSRNQLSVHLVHFICLVLALAGGLTAWRIWRAVGATWPDEEGGPVGRNRFIAGISLILSPLFALVIIAMWIPAFFLNPCQ